MAVLSGSDASFTWAGQTLPESECAGWTGELGYRMRNITPIGWVGERWRGTLQYATVEADFYVDGNNDTPPIPNNTGGVLRLKDSSNRNHAFTAIATTIGKRASGPEGAPNVIRYRFVMSASSNTDAITTATSTG